ncbi:Na+/H+ antiporter [Agromyces seonyuensis]|uniref:Na+/H+ antiporter n=1 Tax=Agromyces seonyuensis TaxID=2662446 RepID=A0A6I4NUX7_9MICO|nr:Na+/H+ antiporter [Agromyces seonyuensis]MWB98178.1 Na+/H+ antiporter [Agromyces seonyuensis]
MEGLEVTVLLALTILAGTVVAMRVRIAAPLVLLVLGLLLGFVPQLREVQLPPETVLLLFLPVMLFWESLTTSLRSIRRDFRGIVLVSTLLVVVTAFAVGGAAAALGVPWTAALILGAAIAPPDATAVSALGRSLPRRNFMLLKAESLTNDGTALVVYGVAVGIATGDSYTAWDLSWLVVLSYLGGIAAGLLVAWAAYLFARRRRDALTINLGLFATPFTAYLLAELIGASGVLAVVVAGLFVSYQSARISTAASRRLTESAWPFGSYLLNGALFVLVGIEVQVVAREIPGWEVAWLLLVTVVVWVVMLVVRFVFQVLSITLIRLIDRRPSQRARRMSHRARVVSTVAGFRGAVSLALALAVPATASGAPLEGRDEIIFVTAGVILLTLLVQGPLLPAVVRWARFPEDFGEDEERSLAERSLSGAAYQVVDELADELGVGDDTRERVRRDLEERLEVMNAKAAAKAGASLVVAGSTGAAGVAGSAGSADPSDATGADPLADEDAEVDLSPVHRFEEYRRMQLAILDRKREVLLRLRRDGSIDDAVANSVQTRLDVEEQRIAGVEAID